MPPKKSQKVRSSVSIVGAGRLGTALGLALAQAGYDIKALLSRHRAKALQAASLFEKPPIALEAKRLKDLPQSDLILIATPDDAIYSTAYTLATSAPSLQPTTVLHTSGALSSLVLANLAKIGFHTGSIHPLVSVSDPRVGAQALRDAFYCVEGDRTALKVARSLVRDLNGHSFSIDTRQKALYHAAAVMSSGHLVALLDTANEMLINCGLTPITARKVLLPLIKSTISNLEHSTAEKALTGTFSRGDLATVREHIKALNAAELQTALLVYKLLGDRSIEIAKRSRRMKADSAKRVQTLLREK